MVFFLTAVSQFWSAWGLQIAVYCSFGSHLIVIVFARSRRHGTCPLARKVLWLAYQAAELWATYALGDLTLSGCDASDSRQQQLIAFWAPFMLLHLGGPDNIAAFDFEDNDFSWRKLVEMLMQCVSSFFTLYNYIWLTDDSGVLRPASGIMFVVGSLMYVEKFFALSRGKISKMKRSSNNTGSLHILSAGGEDQALLSAHKLFPCCKRAMSDSSVDMAGRGKHFPSEKIFELKSWKEIRTVVEMELSLVYDIIYTKAAVIHTWHGYLLRLVSPLLTGGAAVLFCWFYPKHDLKPRDVRFTYIMLAAAFLLHVMWLLSALGSSWAYSYLRNPRSTAAWLLPCSVRHGEWCRRGWRWLHHVVTCLDPCWWLCGRNPRSYRRWSGVAGRCNLLDECTRAPRAGTPSPYDWIKKREHQYLCCLFKCRQGVEEMLFDRILERLQPLLRSNRELKEDEYSMKDITTRWGHMALKRKYPTLFGEPKPPFALEFQEDILAWHIGTSIFLLYLRNQNLLMDQRRRYGEATELVSEYLMFLVALRPHMLPGLVLRSLMETTCESLHVLAKKNSTSGKKLVEILYDNIVEAEENKDDIWGSKNPESFLIADGIRLARALLKPIRQPEKTKKPKDPETLLEFIFDVWVDKLIYAGVKCKRESHAKQLSRGGELTTIVWMIVEHIGTFRIGETSGKLPVPPMPFAFPPPQFAFPPPPYYTPDQMKPSDRKEDKKPYEDGVPKAEVADEEEDDDVPMTFSTLYPADY